MPDAPRFLADRLEAEGGRVLDFFNQLTRQQWLLSVFPGENSWDFHDLLAHCVSSEIGRKKLISDVLSGNAGAPAGFDIDAFNQQEIEQYSGESNEHLLELFRQERTGLVNLVANLREEELLLTGRDPYLGEVQLVEMIKLTYRHLQIHLREARQRL